MPKLAVTHIPQTVRLATTRPAGDAASDRLVETRIIHAPNRVVADVGTPPTEFAPQMLLVGDLVGGARFLLPAGRQTVRFRAPNGEVREWSGVLTYRSTSNLVRILNFLGIAPGSPIDEARGKLREGLRQGWDQADLDDARLLLSVISAGPYVDPDRPAEVPPLESLARFAIETPMDWSALRAISGPTTTSTASTPPAHISTPRTDSIGGSMSGAGQDGPPPSTPQPSTLTIAGMPPGGATYVDGVRTNDVISIPLSRIANGELFWVVPASPGTHTLRIVPPEGEARARTRTVEVPQHGTTMFRYSEMAQATPATTGTGIRRNVPSTLRVIGMPEGGAVFLNGTRADDALSRWSDSGPRGWVVPALAGSATVRVVPLTGTARSATVTIPSSGEATVTFSEMTPEAVARPTILVVTGMPSGGTISVNGTALDMSTGMWGDGGAWAMPAQPGQSSVTITPPVSSGAPARRADVMITPSATTTIAFSTMSEVPGTGPAAEPEKHDETQPPAHGNETPAHGTDEPQKRDETPPPVDHSHDEEAKRQADADHPAEHPLDTVVDGTVVSTGRVVVRTTLPNVAGMVQRVDGSDVAHGAMVHSPDGTLTASVPPGSYQLVVWQEAGFPSIARTNVRTAPANVIVGADSVFSYTGAALTALVASMTNGSHADVVTQRLRDLFSAGGTVDLALLHFTELSR